MIYFDNAATTNIADEVLEEMMPYLSDKYGNPGSRHRKGAEALEAIDTARHRVALLLGCDHSNVFFTSCGSESNTLAITGLTEYLKTIGKRHIITTAAEHESVIESVMEMERRGFDITILPVDETARVSIVELDNAIRGDTGLIAVMAVNNELGTDNDIRAISEICRKKNVLFHCDCVQAALGHRTEAGLFDSCSISGHKIHAPKGIGAVYLRNPERYHNIIFGGEQENGLRPGTQNVAGIVALGKAAEMAYDNRVEIISGTTELCRRFAEKLNGTDGVRCFYSTPFSKIVSVYVYGVDAQSLIIALDNAGVAVSSGAACTSHEVLPNRVLKAAGRTDEEASSTIRVSFSEYNTKEEVDEAAEILFGIVEKFRTLK